MMGVPSGRSGCLALSGSSELFFKDTRHVRIISILFVIVLVLVLVHVEYFDLPTIAHTDTSHPSTFTSVQSYTDTLAFLGISYGLEISASSE